MNAGLIHERRGQWEEAETSFTQAIEQANGMQMRPEIAESLFHLARLKFKTRDLAAARTAYDRARSEGLATLKPHLVKPFEDLGRQIETASRESGDGASSAESANNPRPA
jgi:Tfp pilus assembly protein PilF